MLHQRTFPDAYIRRKEDTALGFILEATFGVIPQCHFAAQSELEHNSDMFVIEVIALCIDTSPSCCCRVSEQKQMAECFSSTSAEDCNRAGKYPIVCIVLGV